TAPPSPMPSSTRPGSGPRTPARRSTETPGAQRRRPGGGIRTTPSRSPAFRLAMFTRRPSVRNGLPRSGHLEDGRRGVGVGRPVPPDGAVVAVGLDRVERVVAPLARRVDAEAEVAVGVGARRPGVGDGGAAAAGRSDVAGPLGFG